MPKIESILCPVDFSQFSADAYEYAQSLAVHYHAKLLLQNVRYSPRPSEGWSDAAEEVRQKYRADVEQQLKEFARYHLRTAIEPECFVQDGPVTDLILSLAETRAVSLIVMGTHGLRGVDRLMVGSVTERVLRRAHCPVLAVRKPAHQVITSVHDPEPVHLKKILVCSDFSDHARRASKYALSMAKEYGAELTLLHVLEDVREATDDLQKATENATKQLEQSLTQEDHEACNVKVMVRVGKPYAQIIEFALEAQSDMVIMGVRGRGALDTALFGSTTYRVIQLGPCPVLAIHI